MDNDRDIIDIITPVHNEGASIENTLRDFYYQASKNDINIRFIICEDGSTDNTVEILQRLSFEIPILLMTSKERKGYSKAVIDGFKIATSKVVGFIDSDGQCDPEDFIFFYKKILEGYDFVIGYRNPRKDHWVRKVMSFLFKLVYKQLFFIPYKDPSCPYMLLKRDYLSKILEGNVGILKQGFWWEFLARIQTLAPNSIEIPINHRVRAAGTTQVYKISNIFKIAFSHLIGLIKLKKELKIL